MDKAKGMTPMTRLLALFTFLAALSIFVCLTIYSQGYVNMKMVSFSMLSNKSYTSSHKIPQPTLYLSFSSSLSPSSSYPFSKRALSPSRATKTPPALRRLDSWTPLSSFSGQKFDEIAGLFQQTRVNCSDLYSGQSSSVQKAVAIAKVLAAEEEKLHAEGKRDQQDRLARDSFAKTLVPEVKQWSWQFQRLTNQWYINATRDCETFKRTRGYIQSPLTREEKEFPIAFSMLVFKDLEMVERLLRVIYRPQNRYCIHVDSKADTEFYTALESVAACFPDNVRMSSRRVDVRWGTFTVLEPELICMQDLLEADQENATSGGNREKWKYFINLTGQEFPLKTNHELVRILKAYSGANNEEGTRKRANRNRWKSPAPHGIIPTKGGVHTVLNRATVRYIIHNETAKDFIEWLKHTGVPDETLFASINYNPQLKIPGTYNGKTKDIENKMKDS
ncbi:beta-1,3-galactosyl-O-glycosyl-glycoprotein beta-1,6-N-acetylglucosaminyltransferase [Elysia marginata]|uniref:Beta-1,3-galactosyl-O-glycosyl-glycoprotein beta-1,6-N-acetylglucosaminyltransferase n=1 Tax=Elysia marginata TaxID=1093978 RepID=A0AAV4GAJ3_9GAST|nr:beta-1,3-galactosyl-O-glycosyl-glycoprotein beta-1,6-N-acetylglucosaminyltransferase [Elysia marginata]